MVFQGFADLDELILLCRNEKARSFIQEAVQCYKSGAYRQAIVATWIAVVYDIIHKLQELELTGDGNAAKHLEQYEKIRKAGDLRGSLDFEKNILDIAKKDFELISDIEHIDLERLKEDRNRCAHPAMNGNDEIYQPTPELARTHIRNAIEHLLQRHPVQGKAALGKLVADVKSQYFPLNVNDAVKYFSSGPLARPRSSLVRNFLVILLKELFKSSVDDQEKERIVTAIKATRKLHLGLFTATFSEKLNDVVDNVPDTELNQIVVLLPRIKDTWQFLKDNSKNRIKNFIEHIVDGEEVPALAYALNIEDLNPHAAIRIKQIYSRATLEELIEFYKNDTIPEILIQQAVNLYIDSGSFDRANSLANGLIIPLVEKIENADILRIIQACSENSQIGESFSVKKVLCSIYKKGNISEDKFLDQIRVFGLDDKVSGLFEIEQDVSDNNSLKE